MGAVADVQTRLQNQNIVDGATGWTSYRRYFPDEAKVVSISEDGGFAPEIGVSTGLGDTSFGDPGVQVMVRASKAGGGDESFSKAEEIRSDLHGKRDIDIDGTTYLRIIALTSEPVHAGYDENGRSIHTIAFRLKSLVGA